MPRIDLDAIDQTNATGYPAPYAAAVAGRWVRRLGPVHGLSDFGVSHVVLKPGAASSQRHWHEEEDEFVVMLEGEAVLVEEESRVVLKSGEMAAFPKGVANGHQLVNESDADCAFLAFGRVPTGAAHYPDIDMAWSGSAYRRKDGSGF
jgi:uncharacterized cupin superfamily protein